MMLRFPDDRLTIILLANSDSSAAQVLAGWVSRYYQREARPIEDTDGEPTRRFKRTLRQLTEGEVDLAQFTPEARATLFPHEASAFYRSLGLLKSLRLIEQTSDESARTHLYRYQTVFRDTAWFHRFVLAPDGKIAEVDVELK